MKKYAEVLGLIFCWAAGAYAITGDLSVQVSEPTYEMDISRLFFESIEKSYKVNAQIYQIESEQHLYDAANYYYIPSVMINSEVKQKMRRPGHPSPFTDFILDMTAKIKLWSNTTSAQKNAAYCTLKASQETYNDVVNRIYSDLNKNVIKIELARTFISKSEEYRKQMNTLLKKIETLSLSGILKKSDRLFAEVAIKKFEESVLNVKTQVAQYKSLINNITPDNLYKEKYGVSRHYINSAINLDDALFSISGVVNKNFTILAKKAELASTKKTAEGNNELFNIELVTKHNIKENRKTSTKNEENQAVYGYTYDDDGQSYIGIQLTFSGLNYKSHKEKKSQYSLYTRKIIELDEYIHQVYVDLNTYRNQYNLIQERIANINEQIALTSDATNSMMKELMADESSAYDIFRNLTSLSDLEMNYLNQQNELVDLSIEVKFLNSLVPRRYVIN